MSKVLKFFIVIGLLITGIILFINVQYSCGNIKPGIFLFHKNNEYQWFRLNLGLWEYKVYLLPFLFVCVNLLFVFLSKFIKAYRFISLILVMSPMFLLTTIRHTPLIIISLIFAVVFLLFIKFKACWETVILLNCLYIFIHINWIGLTHINRSPFSSHAFIIKYSNLIRYNIENMFNNRGMGYFISNAGVIVAILSIVLLIIFNYLLQRRCSHKSQIS
ncbi:UNVERIFIED_CONTAM: hypothetical protein Cloal_3667 [Acetivibrio alkalicellulosi]